MNKIKLQVGNWSAFKIISLINIPYDQEYFILKNEQDNKFLLPTIYYKNYNLKLNQILICRVDKMNCRGRIFLEPMHPYYYEGETYDFKFLKFDKIQYKKEQIKAIIVKDILGNEGYVCNYDSKIQLNENIKCKVEKIKKGKLYLTMA